jgi:hypothetical protein
MKMTLGKHISTSLPSSIVTVDQLVIQRPNHLIYLYKIHSMLIY